MSKTISHRELRNQSGAVLQAVAEGATYTVTNNGQPVARLVPIDTPVEELRLARPATKHGGFSELNLHTVGESIADALDDLRGDR